MLKKIKISWRFILTLFLAAVRLAKPFSLKEWLDDQISNRG